jgi:CBS domain containing-hemolysin-like protein
MQVAYLLLWPAAALVRQVGQQVGSDEKDDAEESVFMSDESLRLLMDVDDDQEPILDSEKAMIESILEMDETVAREVMVPRIDIVSLPAEATLREALDTIIKVGHSRIPVYEENIDHVIGFLYAKDLLKVFQGDQADAPIRSLLREAHFVPASKKLNALLREMQKHRVHIAMVVDEYGGTAGLVTIEDILEEIVGEIEDEYDEVEEPEVEAIGPNAYLLSARYDVYSLSKLLGVQLPNEDADTLGGLLYGQFGHVPEPGESVVLSGWRFTVLSLDGRGIDQVRAESVDGAPPAGEETEEIVGAGNAKAEGRGSVLNYSASE